MKNSTDHHLLLIHRYLDQTLSEAEQEELSGLLKDSPELRRILMETAEQGLVISDIQRLQPVSQGFRAAGDGASAVPAGSFPRGVKSLWIRLAAVVAFSILSIFFLMEKAEDRGLFRVTGQSGACRVFSPGGLVIRAIEDGSVLRPGSKIETLSTDSWLQFDLENGTRVCLSGMASLHLLEWDKNETSFYLNRGNFWVDSSRVSDGNPFVLQTDFFTSRFNRAQFRMEVGLDSALVLVNEGEVKINRSFEETQVEVAANHYAAISADPEKQLRISPEESAVNSWSSNMNSGSDSFYGRLLGWTNSGLSRVGTIAIPAPIPNQPARTVFATAFFVEKSNSPPVLLEAGSRIRITFELAQLMPVHVGFATKKLRGFFAGKYEGPIEPAAFDRLGEGRYQMEVGIETLDPLCADFPQSALNHELMAVWAFTENTDAGLVLNLLEILPP